MKKFFILTTIAFSIGIGAQGYKKPLISEIKKEKLKKDVYELASDHYRGREAGTTDELTAAARIADMAKDTGIQPYGDNGTFFQFFNLERFQLTQTSFLEINNKKIEFWKDIIPHTLTNTEVDTNIKYLGKVDVSDLKNFDFKGRVVVIEPTNYPITPGVYLAERRYPEWIRMHYTNELEKLGAKGVIFTIDGIPEKSWEDLIDIKQRGAYGVEGFRDKPSNNAFPVFWVRKSNAQFLQNEHHIRIHLELFHYTYPSVNVIGKIEGTDPKLKNEYVLLSGHHDHEGVRHAVENDSIYNGADDNASMCAALLSIAKAYKKQPSKRSILFIFHGAEERYLLGSFYHMNHLVVPKENIVAVLNGDMIGRNNINEAALLGSVEPHVTSKDLVTLSLQANAEGPKFKMLEEWDKPDHPEIFFFRSDHLPYARKGLPSVFFTSVLHNEYHTPKDSPENINYEKLHKMTEWIYRTSWKVANESKRPVPLSSVKFER